MALRALGRSSVMTATPLGETFPLTNSSAEPAMTANDRRGPDLPSLARRKEPRTLGFLPAEDLDPGAVKSQRRGGGEGRRCGSRVRSRMLRWRQQPPESIPSGRRAAGQIRHFDESPRTIGADPRRSTRTTIEIQQDFISRIIYQFRCLFHQNYCSQKKKKNGETPSALFLARRPKPLSAVGPNKKGYKYNLCTKSADVTYYKLE